jgi:hypothetical protein
MASDDIRLEGFAEHLKGRKIYCVANEANIQQLVRSCVSSLDTEIAHRGRKALFIQDGCKATSWLFRMKWDAIFYLREAQDIRLALTYVVNAAKPVRVVYAGGEPSSAIFQYLSKQDAISLIGFGLSVPKSTEWDAIFWKGVDAENIEPLLYQRIGIQTTEKYHLKTVLKELKSSELALVWSSIGESEKNGSLYWHDPSDATQASTYSPEETADILRTIADSLSRVTYGRA